MRRLRIENCGCNPCCGGGGHSTTVNTTKYVTTDNYSFVVVQDTNERDKIPCQLRQDGMIVLVVQDNYSQYELQANNTNKDICDNSSWVKITKDSSKYVDKNNLIVLRNREEYYDNYINNPEAIEGQLVYFQDTDEYKRIDSNKNLVDPFPNKINKPTSDNITDVNDISQEEKGGSGIVVRKPDGTFHYISLDSVVQGEVPDLQKVTEVGNETDQPILVEHIWHINTENSLFQTDVKELAYKRSLGVDNYIIGHNNLTNLPDKVLPQQFHSNFIAGKYILNELVGEGTKSYYDGRAIYNDCNVIVGLDLANTKQFKTAENNIIFGSDIFHDDFGTEEGNDFHAYCNTVVGFNIQSHQNLYNIHQNKPEFTKTNIALNTIVGQNFHANVYERATILGHIQYGNQYKRSIIIGYSEGVGAHKDDFSGPQHNYDKNIIISNGFNPNTYKDASKVSNYLYIGNETPLMEGILDTTNKRLKTYGRFQIDGNDPKNNVQGDSTYTKRLVAKPDGTIGLVNDITLNSKIGEKSILITRKNVSQDPITNHFIVDIQLQDFYNKDLLDVTIATKMNSYKAIKIETVINPSDGNSKDIIKLHFLENPFEEDSYIRGMFGAPSRWKLYYKYEEFNYTPGLTTNV